MFVATGTYRIERGTVMNDFGDETDTPNVIARAVPAAITERTMRTTDGSSLVRAREIVGRFRPGRDVREDDRVVDERTGEKFTVEMVERSGGMPVLAADVITQMVRTTP